MIVLLHPRTGKPKNRRFPLAILSIAAILEGKEEYAIVDGNLDPRPSRTLDDLASQQNVELLAVSVMPGPQMVAAIELCREFRRKYPSVPIVWGGYFPSLYTDTALNAGYVDFAVRGQGEETFVELLAALRGQRNLASVRGLAYKDTFGLHRHNPERPLCSPNDFPWLPYHRLPAIEKYFLPTFLGRRTAVHQASIGCPFRCQFCGVVPIFDGRQKTETPARTAAILSGLKKMYQIDAVQFYDNNFFLNESHAREQAELLIPLRLRWWAEGRIDTLLRYSDNTLRAIRRSGATMIFFGAESGSDKVLAEMNKRITTGPDPGTGGANSASSALCRNFRSLSVAPADPEEDTRDTIRFIRKHKTAQSGVPRLSSSTISLHRIRTVCMANVDGRIKFPSTPEEWATERWLNFTIRQDPRLPWLPRRVKRRIDNFELVINSRWPTVQDIRLPEWGRTMFRTLSAWRYSLGVYDFPVELEWAQKFVALRKPRWESL